MNLKQTIKDWMLPIAMVTGASLYLIYNALPEPVHKAGPFLNGLVEVLQPLLIFAMLFLPSAGSNQRNLSLTDGIGGFCSFREDCSRSWDW